jgi:hypothetical protein
MKIKFEDLLKVIGKEDDREEFVRLGQQYAAAHKFAQGRAEPQAEAQREAALGQLIARLQEHFKPIRHPIPSRQELEEMAVEYFE